MDKETNEQTDGRTNEESPSLRWSLKHAV